MKRLPVVILVMLVVLVAVVTGCSRVPHYDSRLVAADSLMRTLPDSALALVEAVSPDSLSSEGDRAYRDLLLTQARYRCYVVATSDSAINRALNYYSNHSNEREKLTRAYIYKGAVMEELGHPDSAMFYYKHAEATATPDDYFNLGYVKLRIAELYQYHILQDSAAIVRLHDAIRYFDMLHDTLHVISALGKLGSICGVNYPDSARHYLIQAIELSQQFNPLLQYSHKSTLAGCYFAKKDYERAKELSMDILCNGSNVCNETQFYYYAAFSYIKLGLVDSAKYVLAVTPSPIDEVDSMNYYNVLAEIANSENRHTDYKDYKERSTDMTERILIDSQKNRLAVIEAQCDSLETQNHYKLRLNHAWHFVVLALLGVVMFAVGFFYYRLKYKKHKKRLIAVKKELENVLIQLHEEKDKSVSAFIAQRMDALNELYHGIRIKIKDDSRVKKIIPLSSLFKMLSDKNEIINIEPSEEFWEKMRSSVNGEYNDILVWVKNQYPNLTERDMKLLCLMCANLSPQIIRLCMNMSTPRTVTNNKSLIIKKKMGLDMSFDTFVEKYMKGDVSALTTLK